MASVRHAVPLQARSGAAVVLERDGASAVFAPWQADEWVRKVSQLSGGEPAVLRAALDRTLRDLVERGEAVAGLAAVHLVQALVLASLPPTTLSLRHPCVRRVEPAR
jgi:hypothetical protein